jgi:predicted nucleic acid-binding protein
LATSADAAAVADSSVAVPLSLEAHPDRSVCAQAVHDHRCALAGHAWFESYSVLTRLPTPHRLGPAEVQRLLAYNFPTVIWVDQASNEALTAEVARGGIRGGAVYDALVAASARSARLPLLTRDQRARVTYERLGVEVIQVG